MTRRTVTCDLDLTLCDTSVRDARFDPFNPANPATDTAEFWEAYHFACDSDTPIMSRVWLLVDLARFYDVVFISNRSEAARAKTVSWLLEHVPIPGLADWPLHDGGDLATTRLVLHEAPRTLWTDPIEEKVRKVRAVAECRPAAHLFHLDDQAAVAGALARHGLVGLCVADLGGMVSA